jgi:hypothetical protein
MPSRRAPALDRGTPLRFWVVLLAALCVAVASLAGPWEPGQREEQPSEPPRLVEPSRPAAPADPDAVAPPPAAVEPGRDLGWVRRALTIAVVAALLFMLVRWALRLRLPVRPPAPEPAGPSTHVAAPRTDPDPEVLHRGARAAEERLRAAVAPDDAVIAAWVALEEAAALSGVVRERSATATEFTLQVLDRTPADPAAARTLLALYLRARFDDRPLGAGDVGTAATAARELVATLQGRVHRAGPATPDGAGPP